MTLLILAAGMGSRCGGLKQLDPVTDEGELIIDFSVYDAVISGFDRIVFVIKEENTELFRETVGKRFEDKVKVEYAFQKLDDLPCGFSVPCGREKPWGTAHAVLAARNVISEPFAVKEMMDKGECSVKVYSTSGTWYGVTYKEDREHVVAGLAKLKADGVYPTKGTKLHNRQKGMIIIMKNQITDTNEALAAYFASAPSYCEPYGNGHINDTYLVIAERRYILQRMNTDVFPRPAELMENILGVTRHIRAKGAVSLTVVPTSDGAAYFCDANGSYWRMYEFVEGTVTREVVENAEDFRRCAEAFGKFSRQLADYPAESLHEPIANFHNTPWRYDNLMKAVKKDACGRLCEVTEEVEFARARKEFCSTLENARAEGRLPLRVTHNDTKLNNILFDERTGEPVCVIDLDTVMPGYSVNDFGDSIRFGANTAVEDETDLSRVTLDLTLFEAYAEGFLKGCGTSLTEAELELLPEGAMMMTLECGMRFLTDYLEGDVYFKIHRPRHNLERARNQFALVSDMERKLPEMRAIIERLK